MDQAYENFEAAYEIFHSIGLLPNAADCQCKMATIRRQKLIYVLDPHPNVVDLCLEHLVKAEQLRDQFRPGLLALLEPQSLHSKQLLRETPAQREIYKTAIPICFNRKRFDKARKWVQKSKVRSLSDLIELGFVIPGYLLEKIEKTEVGKLLLQETQLVV